MIKGRSFTPQPVGRTQRGREGVGGLVVAGKSKGARGGWKPKRSWQVNCSKTLKGQCLRNFDKKRKSSSSRLADWKPSCNSRASTKPDAAPRSVHLRSPHCNQRHHPTAPRSVHLRSPHCTPRHRPMAESSVHLRSPHCNTWHHPAASCSVHLRSPHCHPRHHPAAPQC